MSLTSPPRLPATKKPGRRYDIDTLRVGAFALLILYHVGMFYVADWHWHVKSMHTAEWLKFPMLLVNRWRLPLLFLISGLAVNFLLRKVSGPRFAWMRIKRLLIPLLFGMAVIVPPQAYCQALYNGAFHGNYWQFLVHYFSFQPWPRGAFDGWYYGITWNHLWYLPYLLAYTLVLAALLPVLRGSVGRWLRTRFCGLRGVKLVLLPALPIVFGTWYLASRYPTTHDLLHDWHMHWVYFLLFLYGYLMGTDTGLWQELKRLRWPLLIGALATFSAYLFLEFVLLHSSPDWQRAGYDFFKYLNTWTWILMLLAWSFTLLNRPFPWLGYANEAVYPWYVLHQTIIVIAGFTLSKLALGPVLEPALVIGVTVLGCLLLHEFVIRRTPWLRPLFGLKPIARNAQPEARPTAVLQDDVQ